MTFDLAISREKKETIAKKGRRQKIKSFGRDCVHRISSEWKECSESRKPSIVVYSQWKLEFKVDQDSQYLYGHEGQ